MAAIRRQALTALLPVRAGREAALARTLVDLSRSLGERLRGGETLHFARLLVVPGEDASARSLSPWLLFETTYDGDLRRHLAELFALAGAELERLLVECEGVSPGGGFAAFEATLERFARRPRAFAATNEDLSVARIREDARLRDGILDFFARRPASPGEERPLELLHAVQQTLGPVAGGGESGLEPKARQANDHFSTVVRLVPLVLGMVVHEGWERVVRLWHDRTEALGGAGATGPVPDAPGERFPQRAFTHVAATKAGSFRRRALRRALELLGSVLGAGRGQGAGGVHSLRFLLLDDGRLLFSSRQDDSLASRLFQLGRSGRALLALVWSSTEGFPRALARHLLGGTDDERWLEWLRSGELRSGFSYSAYPTLTVRDVAQNAELRELVSAEPTAARARRLLELV